MDMDVYIIMNIKIELLLGTNGLFHIALTPFIITGLITRRVFKRVWWIGTLTLLDAECHGLVARLRLGKTTCWKFWS